MRDRGSESPYGSVCDPSPVGDHRLSTLDRLRSRTGPQARLSDTSAGCADLAASHSESGTAESDSQRSSTTSPRVSGDSLPAAPGLALWALAATGAHRAGQSLPEPLRAALSLAYRTLQRGATQRVPLPLDVEYPPILIYGVRTHRENLKPPRLRTP